MAAAAMELRRLGLARKVLIVVPNDILQQFAEEFQSFYLLARLLVPSKDDFTPARRNEFMARIATGDWDAVIVAQSQFTLLPVNPETEAVFVQRELAGYREALSEMADEARERGDRSWRSSEKSIQKAIQRLSARLLGCQKRLEERKRLTQTMTFEDLGVDRVCVDFSSRPPCVFHVGSATRRVRVADSGWTCVRQSRGDRVRQFSCRRSRVCTLASGHESGSRLSRRVHGVCCRR